MKKNKFFMMVLFLCTFMLPSCNDSDDPQPTPPPAPEEPKTSWEVTLASEDSTYFTGNGMTFHRPSRENDITVLTSVARDSCAGEVEVPYYITCGDKQFTVRAIGPEAFSNCQEMTSIKLPKCISDIYMDAFSRCTGLQSVVLSDSLKIVDACIFSYCTSLKSVTIPSSVSYISTNPFLGCEKLAEIKVEGDENLRFQDNCLFDKEGRLITGLNKPAVKIPQSVTTIGEYSFSGCADLASVEIPASVTKIGSQAFTYCSKLESVEIPQSVTEMEESIFMGCDGLLSAKLPSNLETIPYGMFYGCTSLSAIELPASLSQINDNAFYGCTALREIRSLSTTPPAIDGSTFLGTNNLICVVRVPAQAIDAYKSDRNWSTFKRIIAMDAGLTAHFDANKLYKLRSYRGYIPASDELTDNRIYSTYNRSLAGRFRITEQDGGCLIYNTDIQKYLSAEKGVTGSNYSTQTGVAYVDEPNGTFRIYPSTDEEGGREGTYIIESNVTGLWLMFGNTTSSMEKPNANYGNHTGILLNSDPWRTADDGDMWFFTDADEAPYQYDHFTEGNLTYKMLDVQDQSVSIVSGTAEDGELVIGPTVKTAGGELKITSIEDEAFVITTATPDAPYIYSLKMAGATNLTKIGTRAFFGQSKLEYVSIPASVTSIGDQAFYNMSNGQALIYAPSLEYYGQNAFFRKGTVRFNIYVLPESVDAYRAAWRTMSSFIQPMTEEMLQAQE